MPTLLDRSNQALSVTDLVRSAKEVFERLESGEQDKYVVMRNNAPAAVMMPVATYEALIDEIEDLRIEAVARERLQSFDRKKAISHAEMMKRFAK
ncbi:MAG: type II toxin-antitoxin system Phd/YefM family antitoxin [Rhodocyclales bacterium]|jgi:antitoxin StbD|nr:type II toxin-antitoxin system Phd/YefM family antitoxin [Rhodocyclales bacterium]